eukprot:323284-Amorphochlora_amoeboformis.AAC.1
MVLFMLEIPGDLWGYLEIPGDLWGSLEIPGDLWISLKISGDPWSSERLQEIVSSVPAIIRYNLAVTISDDRASRLGDVTLEILGMFLKILRKYIDSVPWKR